MKKYFLDSDGDGHEYIIPSEHKKEWYEFLDLPEDNERSWNVPKWAIMINGDIEFENPSLDGKLLFPRKIIAIDFSTCKNWDECMKWMEGQPDYRTDYDNWLKYWEDSGLIDEKQFI